MAQVLFVWFSVLTERVELIAEALLLSVSTCLSNKLRAILRKVRRADEHGGLLTS